MTIQQTVVRDGLIVFATLVLVPIITIAWHWPDTPAGPHHINVRWIDGTDEETRLTAEAELGLDAGTQQEGQTWQYVVTATDSITLQAIVSHPLAEDTHGINRTEFTLADHDLSNRSRYQLTPYNQEIEHAIQTAKESQGTSLFIFAVIAGLLGCLPTAGLAGSMLGNRLPQLSLEATALMRLVFGALLAIAVWKTSFSPDLVVPVNVHRTTDWLANWELIGALASSPNAIHILQIAATLGLLLFATGVFLPRQVLVCTAVVLTMLVLAKLRHGSSHDWGLPLLAVWALTPVPWNQLKKLDPRVRGYAAWVPGFLFGLSFAAAAIAKLRESGFSWITTGAVRYHFVEDAEGAVSTLGLWIASHEQVAVAVSTLAIIAELLLLLTAFSKTTLLRLLGGTLGTALLLGFWLLQGVFWPAWWALLLAFLPWNQIAAQLKSPSIALPTSTISATPAWIGRVLALFVGIQLAASLSGTEHEPLISDFPMYSHTYSSPASFNEVYGISGRRYSFYVSRDSDCAENVTSEIESVSNLLQSMINLVERLDTTPREELDPSITPVTATLLARVNDRGKDYVDTIMVQAASPFFDFKTGRTAWRTSEPVAEFKQGSVHTSTTNIYPCDDSNLNQ